MTSTTDLVLFSQALLHKSARKIVHDILLKIVATPRECAACSLSGKSAALLSWRMVVGGVAVLR